MSRFLVVLLVLVTAVTSFGASTQKIVRLTSLYWPPYTGSQLNDLGTSTAVVRAAFAAMGYELKVDFYPWSRAVRLAETDPGYVGYFPEYYSKENARKFIYSQSMGSGPLGFAERKEKPIKWSKLSDLVGIKIGVVQDYVNTEAFDQMVSEKRLDASSTISDASNIAMLNAGRIDLAVVDRNVFDYLLAEDSSLEKAKTNLHFNEKILENKKLFVCFKNNEEGKKWSAIFNSGLKKLRHKNKKQIHKHSSASIGGRKAFTAFKFQCQISKGLTGYRCTKELQASAHIAPGITSSLKIAN